MNKEFLNNFKYRRSPTRTNFEHRLTEEIRSVLCDLLNIEQRFRSASLVSGSEFIVLTRQSTTSNIYCTPILETLHMYMIYSPFTCLKLKSNIYQLEQLSNIRITIPLLMFLRSNKLLSEITASAILL